MKRSVAARWGIVCACLALLVGRAGAWLPNEAPAQPPTDAGHTVFLPSLHRAASPRPVGEPPQSIAIAPPAVQYAPDEAVPGRVLVKWRDGVDSDTIARINDQLGVETVGAIDELGIQVVAGPTDSVQPLVTAYTDLPEVAYAEPDFIAGAMDPVTDPTLSGLDADAPGDTTNDPLASQQYSLGRMDLPGAWAVSHGDGVVIAILDSGADFAHPDLQGKFVSRGRDFVNKDLDASDDNGHGTHVAGIAAAATNNGVGMAGVGYNARLLPVKVLGATGSGSYSTIAAGITWAADQGVQVVNLSLGGAINSQTLRSAVDYAWGKGVVIVAAAGDNSSSAPYYPAALANAIGVGATDQNDAQARFSDFGPTVDVAAPGASILSTIRGGGYQAWSGTSMAAANAAGVAALVAAAHPTWNNAQIRAALENTADNSGVGTSTRHGRLNAGHAVGATSLPTPTFSPTPPTATPAPTVTPASQADYARQLVDLINQQRQQNGALSPLKSDSRLSAAADSHNQWMRTKGCFSHQCTGEPDAWTRMSHAGYPFASGSEVIGQGYQTPQDMVAGWMRSADNAAVLLSAVWPDVGCAYSRGPLGLASNTYWTCDFAHSGAIAATVTATVTSPAPPASTSTPTLIATATSPLPPSGTPTPTATASPPSTPTPTATASPSGTPTPTATVSPLSTPTPTATASPSGTPTPTPMAAPSSTVTPGPSSVWQPTTDAPIHWHWQLSSDFTYPADVLPSVTVYDLDGELTSAQTVAQLHALGPNVRVICYMDAGVYETYRSDAAAFQAADAIHHIIGSRDQGWAGSYWLDIRQINVLKPLMLNRINNWCKAKGFDAVEPDETEVYGNNSGFPITVADDIAYNIAFASWAHEAGLSVGLKGNNTEAPQLSPYFDWALTEQCWEFDECDNFKTSFLKANKAVFSVEYDATPDCTQANAMHMNASRRDLDVVGPHDAGYLYQPCIPDTQDHW
ncbi:MAG: S8 family serine peptidase [Anaerolineae bacterium]